MIKKIKGKYIVLSESTGRKFGTYKTKKEAEKRLKQIEFFKHLKGNTKLRGKLRKKSLEQAKKFTWHKTAKTVLGVLEEVVTR